jgi:predicted kinase
MSSPLLVVIQGAPGVGKTTLAQRLRQDTAMPLLGKDDVKEMLFEHLPQSNKEFSRLQGMVSFEMLYTFARTFLKNEMSVIIEGAFHTELSRQNIQTILDETEAEFFEIFCHLDEDVRRQRFEDRSKDGTRHPAHLDNISTLTPASNYLSLGLGESVSIDTGSSISEEVYSGIIKKIQQDNVLMQARSG